MSKKLDSKLQTSSSLSIVNTEPVLLFFSCDAAPITNYIIMHDDDVSPVVLDAYIMTECLVTSFVRKLKRNFSFPI